MRRKILVVIMLVVSIFLNIFQWQQLGGLKQYYKTSEDSMILLVKSATGKSTSIILNELNSVHQKDVGIILSEYRSRKQNFLYMLYTNQGMYNDLLNLIIDNRFENYLLKILGRENLTDVDLFVLDKYHGLYNNFMLSVENDTGLDVIINFKSLLYAYAQLVKDTNELVEIVN